MIVRKKIINNARISNKKVFIQDDIIGKDAELREELKILLDNPLAMAIAVYGISHPLVKKVFAKKYNIDIKAVPNTYKKSEEFKIVKGLIDG